MSRTKQTKRKTVGPTTVEEAKRRRVTLRLPSKPRGRPRGRGATRCRRRAPTPYRRPLQPFHGQVPTLSSWLEGRTAAPMTTVPEDQPLHDVSENHPPKISSLRRSIPDAVEVLAPRTAEQVQRGAVEARAYIQRRLLEAAPPAPAAPAAPAAPPPAPMAPLTPMSTPADSDDEDYGWFDLATEEEQDECIEAMMSGQFTPTS